MNELFSNTTDDELLFADEVEENADQDSHGDQFWKVLIVDDEPEVHKVTKLVFDDFSFEGKSISFFNAYSADEARMIADQNPDLAVIFLDVVMEETDSGLKYIQYIREKLENKLVRIILRTGQPGHAPEKRIILEYDINDYKEKTELTASKLFTVMVSALRNYKDLVIINSNKKSLERIIEASSSIFELQSMKKFAESVLNQLVSLLNIKEDAIYYHFSSFAASRNEEDDYYIVVGTGKYRLCNAKSIDQAVDVSLRHFLNRVIESKKSLYEENKYAGYFTTGEKSENLIYIECDRKLEPFEIDLINIFCSNISIAFDNLYLKREIEETQREIIFTLGELTEARSHETGNHVKRVSKYCRLIAEQLGLDEDDVNTLAYAAPMHDIGKISIPDAILNKPGKLTPEEFDIMKTHAAMGYEILKSSNRNILKMAARICLEHHERYDGAGYPNGLKGDEINIFGRIVSLVDVFDALGHERVYKEAWPLDEVIQYIHDGSGKQFDPKIVEAFDAVLDEIKNVYTSYKD